VLEQRDCSRSVCGKPYVLGLASEPSGGGTLELLLAFMTNPAGAAVVDTIGPMRQLVRGEENIPPVIS
jgi:hypothetical protein